MEVLRFTIYALAIGGSILCFVNYKKLPAGFFWLGIYLLFAALSQVTGFLLAARAISNIELYNIIIFPYTLFSYLIYYKLTDIKRIRLGLNIVFAIGLALVCVSIVQDVIISEFSFRALLISSLVAVVGSLLSLYGKIKNPMHISPLKMGWLWVLMGFLFYYSSTFSYWIAYRFTENIIDRSTLALINVTLVLIFYLILLTAIIVQLKFSAVNVRPKSRTSIKSGSLLE